ncbi:MAG: hypothetical protein LBH96_00600 [Candidatus Peribacteria bacterium]|jgi:hypothetical protein|nr:hypothetical protein [Candidatus Peribacteria bacterium]
MVVQHNHQYRFFATYGIFRGWKLGDEKKFKGDWSEGVFLYDEEKKEYGMINKFIFKRNYR